MTWNETKTGKLPEPANGWYSLLHLIDHYQVSALANAIEQIGIYVIDQYGRKRHAGGDSSDAYSKSMALKLLSDVYAEQQNPSENPSWDSERWDNEDHPLSLFGWDKEHLPDFNSPKIQPILTSWTMRDFEEFKNEKILAGSYQRAAELHGVSRQRYEKVYKSAKEKADAANSVLVRRSK